MSDHPIEDIDYALEALLPCRNEREFTRTLARIADEKQWGEPIPGTSRRDGNPIERMIWGLFTRLKEYPGAANRSSRSGPWTYAEIRFLKQAIETRSGEAAIRREGKPTEVAYLAGLLMRTQPDVAQALQRYGPAKGRQGFGLGK